MTRWRDLFSRGPSAAPSAHEDWARKSEQVGRAKEARRAALVGQEALVAEVSAILFETDLVGINIEENADEYDSEAETIVLRLGEACGPADVQRIAHEEFVRWFDPQTAGPPERYAAIGRMVWAAANRRALP